MNVYVVQHVHEFTGECEDTKFIGVYSLREHAERAVERLRIQPGFCNALAGFHIDEYVVDQDHWTEGYFTEYEDDKNELQISDLFDNITADILSIQRFDDIIRVLLESTPGEWHSIEGFIGDSQEMRFRLTELQSAIAESGAETPALLYSQWTIYPSNTDYSIVSFHLEGTLLFRSAIYNVSRFAS